MKTYQILWMGLILIASTAMGARQPNVIVIYTDDQGSIDTHAFGAKDLTTPHMDALAKDGVRFTQMYAPAPVCSPSRAGLMTGRYPLRAGMKSNAGSTKGKGGMPASQVTMAEMFKAAGYATGHIGKWHLGYTPETMPNGQGFDHSFGHMGGCIDNYSHFFYWQGPNRHDLWRNGKEVYHDGEFFGDLMVSEAAQFIEANKAKPFYIYFAINMPHYPYQGDVKWLKHYKDLKYPRNLYAAFVSTIDDRIGQLLAVVEKQGLTKDTIIVFQSDHGHSTESRAHGGGGSAGPYRGAKFSMYEGGIRVPSIVKWPGKIPAGQVRGQMVHGCDWFPTLAALAGVKLPHEDLDGKDISKVITADAPSPHQVLHWHTGGAWAVRQGDWKLISGRAKGLYNLAKDVGEKNDLSKANAEKLAELKKLHDMWARTLKKK
jgi:arylsulfatase A